MKIVALLDSMWGWRGYTEPGEEAPRFFKINPNNHSGKRLYRLCGDHELIVTNCCPIVQSSANHHGKPDVGYAKASLMLAVLGGADLILICGNIAKETFLKMDFTPALSGRVKIYQMDHPAARRWSNEKLDATARAIASMEVTL